MLDLEDELRTARGALEDTNAIVAERAVEIDAVRGELAEKTEELRRATEDVEDRRARHGGDEDFAIEESKRASKEKVKKAIAKGKSIESEKKALEMEMETLRAASEEHEARARRLAEAEDAIRLSARFDVDARDKALTFEGMDDALSEEKIRNKDLQAQLAMLHSIEASRREGDEKLAAANEGVERLSEVENAIRRTATPRDATWMRRKPPPTHRLRRMRRCERNRSVRSSLCDNWRRASRENAPRQRRRARFEVAFGTRRTNWTSPSAPSLKRTPRFSPCP